MRENKLLYGSVGQQRWLVEEWQQNDCRYNVSSMGKENRVCFENTG